MSASPVEWGVGRSVVSDETADDPAPGLELVWGEGGGSDGCVGRRRARVLATISSGC